MKISFKKDRYITESPDAKNHGWNQDDQDNVWYTCDPRIALKLRPYCDRRAERELQRTFLSTKPWLEAIPYPPKLKPYHFQIGAAYFALSRNRSYLALDMGLGKTIVAALIFNAMQRDAVYICPPYLCLTVKAEFEKWAPSAFIHLGLEGPKPADQLPEQSVLWIIPDSMVHNRALMDEMATFIRIGPSPILFVDEAHRYSHLEARRTRALFQAFVPSFRKIIFMSGTPMPSRPLDLYPVLSECAPETIDFMNETQYGKHFCGGHYVEGRGWDFSRASNVEELAKRIHNTFMLRMRKEDCLTELPPKTEEMVILEEDLPPALAKMDAHILRELSPEDIVQGIISKRLGIDDEGSLHLSTYLKELGSYKVGSSLAFIKGVLENTQENILVFAFHKDTIKQLHEGLANEKYGPVVVTGKTTMEERHNRVKHFQNESSCRVFIGNYLAAGTGFTLTKATRVIFVEASWVPGENDQAADRAHRIGQKSNVLVQYLVYKNSVDRAVIEVLQKKRKATRHI